MCMYIYTEGYIKKESINQVPPFSYSGSLFNLHLVHNMAASSNNIQAFLAIFLLLLPMAAKGDGIFHSFVVTRFFSLK